MLYIADVCGHNSGRSQMAMGIFNELKKLYRQVDENYEAISWGTGIGTGINPRIIEPMRAIGIDVTDASVYFPKDVKHPSIDKKLQNVIRVYTMGCMENTCELPSGLTLTGDWDLEDPAKPETDVYAIRNKIIGYTLELVVELSHIPIEGRLANR